MWVCFSNGITYHGCRLSLFNVKTLVLGFIKNGVIAHTYTERQRQSDTDRQTDRQTDTKTERQTDRRTKTETKTDRRTDRQSKRERER